MIKQRSHFKHDFFPEQPEQDAKPAMKLMSRSSTRLDLGAEAGTKLCPEGAGRGI